MVVSCKPRFSRRTKGSLGGVLSLLGSSEAENRAGTGLFAPTPCEAPGGAALPRYQIRMTDGGTDRRIPQANPRIWRISNARSRRERYSTAPQAADARSWRRSAAAGMRVCRGCKHIVRDSAADATEMLPCSIWLRSNAGCRFRCSINLLSDA